MPIDRKHIGFRLPAFTVTIEPERLRRFAEAIGNDETQISSGIAPPTYMKVIEGENNSSQIIIRALDIDLRRVLHVEQEFEYGTPIHSGDRVTVERTVSDIYVRKNGAFEFVVVDSTMHNSDGVCVGRSRQWILVRHAAPVTAT
jgi:hypothetical protein